MLQHPIPQNIATYQFHLIGNMTLKQFIELLIGVGLAIGLYKTNLIFFVKWPLIFIFGLVGVAAAFMPYDDRPLDEWFNAFIRAIYSPTQFLWKKSAVIPAYFNYSPKKRALTAEESQAMFNAAIAKKRAGLSSYLQTISENTLITTLEKNEFGKASQYLSLFALPQTSLNVVSPSLNLSTPPATKPAPPPASPPSLSNSRLTTSINVPAPSPISVKPATPTPQNPISPPTPTIRVDINQPKPDKNILYPAQKNPPAVLAVESKKLPFPIKPTTPNTISGMIFDSVGNLIENAIIEIRDSVGNPVRATKTNKLGQFFSTTPLKNGAYEIEIDCPPHKFDILKLELKNKLIDPLEIRAIV